jgi:dephospho-CoA kinase
MVVGITGNYCSGKDIASFQFQESGYRIIDVDRLGHEALSARKGEIVQAFGTAILRNGQVDRKKLGEIVFADQGQKKRLEIIVHPWMVEQVKKEVQTDGYFVINAALLVEMCLHVLCDFVLVVEVDQPSAVRRAVRRDHISKEEALKRLRLQIPVKEKLHFVDKVIDNSGNIGDFRKKVKSVIQGLEHG